MHGCVLGLNTRVSRDLVALCSDADGLNFACLAFGGETVLLKCVPTEQQFARCFWRLSMQPSIISLCDDDAWACFGRPTCEIRVKASRGAGRAVIFLDAIQALCPFGVFCPATVEGPEKTVWKLARPRESLTYSQFTPNQLWDI